jgi:hypothetical protein
MGPYRGNAITAGVLLIACTATSILSVVPRGSLLDAPVDLAGLAVHGNRMVVAALIEFMWAATATGIAVALYPAVRTVNPALALGSVAARLAEGVLVLVGTLSLVVLLSLGLQSPEAGPDGAATTVLLAVREWAPHFLGALAFLLGAAMYYWLMYQGRLVPRWLSGWGLAAVALSLVATLYGALTQDFGFTTLSTTLNIPIFLQEMVLAVWLIAKGFTPSPTSSAPAPHTQPQPATTDQVVGTRA